MPSSRCLLMFVAAVPLCSIEHLRLTKLPFEGHKIYYPAIWLFLACPTGYVKFEQRCIRIPQTVFTRWDTGNNNWDQQQVHEHVHLHTLVHLFQANCLPAFATTSPLYACTGMWSQYCAQVVSLMLHTRTSYMYVHVHVRYM